MKVWKNERGAISIFLITIFLGLLMLAGLIIDISRVMVAERKVQNALDTATRSVAAGYDLELVGQFGLYGNVHTTRQKEELKRYFTANLVDRHQNFHFITYDVNNMTINYVVKEGLLNDEVFKSQICEYMKYKGPILVTQNVIEAFNLGGFGKKADLMDTGKKAQKNMDEIGQRKTTINNLAKNICAAAMKEIWDSASDMLSDLTKIENEIRTMDESITRAQTELDEANKKADEIAKETEECLAAEGKTRGEQPEELEGKKHLEELKKQLEKLKDEISYNKEILEQIKPLEEEYRKLDEREEELDSQKTLLKALLSKISDEQKAELQAIEAEMAEIATKKTVLEEQMRALYNKLRPLANLTFPESEGIKNSLKDSSEKDGLLEMLNKLIDKQISKDNPCILLITDEEFKTACNGLVGEQSGNEEMANFEMTEDAKNDEEVGKNIFGFLSKIGKAIAEIAEGGMERVYITEYIMDKYTFVTSPIKRGHFFNKGEVEYIICGGNSQIGNITSAFGRIWGIRFAVNAVDAFFTCRLPTFWSRLARALIEGFIGATQDMRSMYNGTSVPICKSLEKLSVRLSYSDHLRLLLLLNSEKTNLNRMRQLIQIDIRQIQPNFELKNYGTVIKAEAEVSIDLWFASLLNLDKFGFKQIKGNKYIITEKAIVEY